MSEIQQFDPRAASARLRAKLNSPNQRIELQKALGKGADLDRYIRIALTAHQRGDESLKAALPESVIGVVMQVAQLGLSIDPLAGEAYIVARKSKHHKDQDNNDQFWASLMIGYKGLIKRALRNPAIGMIDAGVVREGDKFDVRLGTEPHLIHHRELLVDSEPDVLCTYAIAHFTGEERFKRIYVAPRYEIEAARSRGQGGGPWRTDYGAMAMKTAVRRLLAMCPTDDETQAAITRETLEESGDYIDVPEDDVEVIDQVSGKPGNLDELKKQVREGAK